MRARSRPACDRHGNLQMIPCSLEKPAGTVSGHICPVPSCGRRHDGRRYYDEEPMASVPQRSASVNRQAAARSAILSAIQDTPTPIPFNFVSLEDH
jgi:hypothetical protein